MIFIDRAISDQSKKGTFHFERYNLRIIDDHRKFFMSVFLDSGERLSAAKNSCQQYMYRKKIRLVTYVKYNIIIFLPFN